MSPRPLRVLFVEDSEDDMTLEIRELRKGGFDPSWERVEDERSLRAALARRAWDLVISDHGLPSFSSIAAYRVVRERDRDVPFLLVSGTIGEGPAVEAMRIGVNDYLLKGNLQRLPAAVDRELREAENRRRRRTSEAALHEAEARNRDLIANAVLGIYRARLDGGFEDANPAMLRMLGLATIEELRARRPQDVFEDRAVAERLHTEWFRTGSFRRVECRWRRTDGRGIVVYLSGRVVTAAASRAPVFEVFVEDVTEQKELEAQLLQAQKLEALGQLAAGVAHDFNNMLTVISGYTELVLSALESDDPRAEHLVTVAQAAERSAALVRQLLAYGRRQFDEPRVLDLNATVRAVEAMVGRLVRADIEVTTELDPRLGAVIADPNQLEHALVNLVVNARDAVKGAGRISIRTWNDELLEDSRRGRSVVPAGDWVAVSVIDDGSGMTEETLARVFDPFFTTKAPGHGTGLGLSTVNEIVRKAGGVVAVESRLGEGSAFTIYLPRRADAEPVYEPPSPAPAHARGAETILLAEDDDPVRRFEWGVLESLGYRMLAASSGTEALSLAARHAGRIDLLVTDLAMPSLGGAELAERLMAARPDLAVLFVSGYAAESELGEALASGRASLLHKPFSPAQLAARVRETLDRARGA